MHHVEVKTSRSDVSRYVSMRVHFNWFQLITELLGNKKVISCRRRVSRTVWSQVGRGPRVGLRRITIVFCLSRWQTKRLLLMATRVLSLLSHADSFGWQLWLPLLQLHLAWSESRHASGIRWWPHNVPLDTNASHPRVYVMLPRCHYRH